MKPTLHTCSSNAALHPPAGHGALEAREHGLDQAQHACKPSKRHRHNQHQRRLTHPLATVPWKNVSMGLTRQAMAITLAMNV
jgi:hypothetical protein